MSNCFDQEKAALDTNAAFSFPYSEPDVVLRNRLRRVWWLNNASEAVLHIHEVSQCFCRDMRI